MAITDTRGGEKRTKENKKLLASALLTTTTIKEASEVSGVSVRTINRHLHDESFLELYREMQAELIEKNNLYLQSKVHIAIDELARLIEAPDTTPGVRIRAIDTLLQHSMRYAAMTREDTEKAEKDWFNFP